MLKDEPYWPPPKRSAQMVPMLFPLPLKRPLTRSICIKIRSIMTTSTFSEVSRGPFPDEQEHAKCRRLPLIQHGAANHRGLQGDAWLRTGFGFSGGWTLNDQNNLLESHSVLSSAPPRFPARGRGPTNMISTYETGDVGCRNRSELVAGAN